MRPVSLTLKEQREGVDGDERHVCNGASEAAHQGEGCRLVCIYYDDEVADNEGRIVDWLVLAHYHPRDLRLPVSRCRQNFLVGDGAFSKPAARTTCVARRPTT